MSACVSPPQPERVPHRRGGGDHRAGRVDGVAALLEDRRAGRRRERLAGDRHPVAAVQGGLGRPLRHRARGEHAEDRDQGQQARRSHVPVEHAHRSPPQPAGSRGAVGDIIRQTAGIRTGLGARPWWQPGRLRFGPAHARRRAHLHSAGNATLSAFPCALNHVSSRLSAKRSLPHVVFGPCAAFCELTVIGVVRRPRPVARPATALASEPQVPCPMSHAPCPCPMPHAPCPRLRRGPACRFLPRLRRGRPCPLATARRPLGIMEELPHQLRDGPLRPHRHVDGKGVS